MMGLFDRAHGMLFMLGGLESVGLGRVLNLNEHCRQLSPVERRL
jgi:hypothetical protein